ncbi:MAG: hypothetical protein IKN55_12385 [Oscillospiraceae bacterium]|nr:hypothetical protein [Oscillospiraceae bacterium]
MMTEPQIPQDMDPDALVALLDALCASGSEHINLTIGKETRVQTVNSTECCKPGACSIPTLGDDPDEEAL